MHDCLLSYFDIYFYNITLNITIIYCKNEISFLFIVLYADNSFPSIPYIALHEDGQVGRNLS